MDGQCVRLLLAYRDDNNLRHLFCWMTRMPCVHVGGCASSGGCSLPPAGSARPAPAAHTRTRSEGRRLGLVRQSAGRRMHSTSTSAAGRPDHASAKGSRGMLFLFFSLFSMLEGKNENPRLNPRGDTPDGLPSPFAL